MNSLSAFWSVRLVWKVAGLKEFAVMVGDGISYTLSTELNGIWEQVYPVNMRITFLFCYVTAEGKGDQVRLEIGGLA